jgi:hypothetical protein
MDAKRTALILAITLACIVGAIVSAEAATLVYLMGGQSNMDGYGVVSELPYQYSLPQPGVKFWSNNAWVDLRGGFGSPYAGFSAFGPEVTFGNTLHTMFPDDNIYLVKYAIGGSTLADAANQWTPNGSGGVYNAFKTSVDAALKNLSDARLSPSIAGMVWMQGESDASSSAYASLYEANLTNLIGTVRSDFATPDMRFALGRIMSYSQYPFGAKSDNDLVRAAQVTVASHVAGVSWIDTDDLPVNAQGTGWAGHYNTLGQINLGIRFAGQFVETPEPGTLTILATGLLGTLAYAWRKRR